MSDQRADDDPSTLSTNNTDPLVPIYTDKTPIAWDGNPAHIAGCLYDVIYTESRFYLRPRRNRQLGDLVPGAPP